MKFSMRAAGLRTNLYLTASILSVTTIGTGMAHANEEKPLVAEDAGDIGSDIIVTGARAQVDRREPAIVTALDSDRINNLGVQKISDITGFVPGLFQPRTGITSSHSTIFVRGIGEITPQGRPAVPVYIDGVFIPRTAGANQDLLDVETIDVARGPQGFLFGHSAEGGAINIRTLTPDNDQRARITLGYGSFNEVRAGAMVSGPLVKDRLFASVAIQHRRRDGITQNLTTGRDDNNIETSSARIKLRWTSNDQLEIIIIFDGTIDHGDAKIWADRKRSTDPDVAYSPIDPKNVYRQFAYTLQINYALNDRLRWESVGGYRHYTYWTNYDNTGDRYGRGIGLLGYNENFYTAETRIVGELPGLDFSIGAHFSREEFQRSGANNGTSTYTTDPNLSTFRPIWSVADQQYNNWALFGQATVAVTNALKLTVGGRLNYEKQFQQMSNYSLGPTASYLVTGWQLDQDILYAASHYRRSTPPPGATLAWAIDVEKAFTRFTPKLALEYTVAPDAKIYASFSQGTHEGGFDNGGLSPLASGATQASLPFSPEKVTTYEAGVRTAFADQAVRLNAAAFYNKFDNIQLSTLDPVTNISRRFNAGTGRSWGIEGDLQVTPIAGLNLGATASYLNAELTSVLNAPATVSFANGLTLNTRPFVGARLPNAPRFQGQANIQYKLGGFGIGGDVQYRTSSFTDALSNDVNRIPKQTLANAFVSYDPTENLTLRVDVRNLTDKRYPQALNYNQNSGTLIVYSATYNDPRTIFGSLTYRF